MPDDEQESDTVDGKSLTESAEESGGMLGIVILFLAFIAAAVLGDNGNQ